MSVAELPGGGGGGGQLETKEKSKSFSAKVFPSAYKNVKIDSLYGSSNGGFEKSAVSRAFRAYESTR